MRKRMGTVLAAAAVMTGVTLTVGASGATAATPQNVRFFVSSMDSDGSRTIGIYIGNTHAGQVYWTANGDELKAIDASSDTFGIYGYLGTSPVREVSTYGHKAPYTATKGGNLTENKSYNFWACIGTDTGGLVCSDVYKVTS